MLIRRGEGASGGLEDDPLGEFSVPAQPVTITANCQHVVADCHGLNSQIKTVKPAAGTAVLTAKATLLIPKSRVTLVYTMVSTRRYQGSGEHTAVQTARPTRISLTETRRASSLSEMVISLADEYALEASSSMMTTSSTMTTTAIGNSDDVATQKVSVCGRVKPVKMAPATKRARDRKSVGRERVF